MRASSADSSLVGSPPAMAMRSCTFIDSSREVMDIVRANIALCSFESRTRYLVSDAKNYIRKASGKYVFDLVFIDPPYASACAGEVLRRLTDGGMLANGAIAVLECGDEIVDAAAFPEFEVTKEKRYGKKTALYIMLYRKEGDNG